MKPTRIRALYKSILTSLDSALGEACKDKNSEVVFHIEEAQELLSVMFDQYEDSDVEELDFY